MTSAEFLTRCLASAPAGRLVAITVVAPRGLPEALLASTTLSHGTLWIKHDEPAFASVGVARRLALTKGPERFSRLRHAIGATFAELVHYVEPTARSASVPLPRFFGGLSFAAGGGDEAPWNEFGDGVFILPRWTYCLAEEDAFLTLVLGPGDARDGSLLDEHDAIVAGIAGTGISMWTPTIAPGEIAQLPVETWVEMLSRAHERLARGDLHKVVVARRSQVPVPAHVKDVTLLVRLRREVPECTRFAFRAERSTFLGATPELLFSKKGDRLRTEALAGSIRCTGSDFPRMTEQTGRLLGSEKDLREHRLVVDQIVGRLDRFLDGQPRVPAPVARRFRNIIHLHTPIAGTIAKGADALAILEALHPTAAVGGVPAADAAACISEIEPCARGWYAGPVGFIDQAGDATFCVAIRSGLLSHPNAYVYAGAGILAESDPIAEYTETGLKQMPMMLALGVDTVSLRATLAPQALL